MLRISEYSYFDREVSWLNFNYRVLQESIDKSNSLLERIKFLGIFSNNQDEFYRVRVATIKRLIQLKYESKSGENTYLQSTLDSIKDLTRKHQIVFEDTYSKIIEELRTNKIHKLTEKTLSNKQGEYVKKYFLDKVQTHLFPILLKGFFGEEKLNDSSIYFAIELLREDKPEKNAYAIMEIPTANVDRFLILPEDEGNKYFIMLDDVIRYCLGEVFARFKFQKFNAFTFKFTRDSELDIDNDVSKSFLEVLSASVANRKRGNAVRFVYDKEMPQELLVAVLSKLKIKGKDELIAGGRYHNFKDFMGFPNIGNLSEDIPSWNSIPHKDIPESGSIIKAIRQKDMLLHYPYQSFQYVIDLLREASIDPKVISIKMTLYRVANPSNVINALINAARNGKKVTVFLEIKARFDEEANIYWSEQLHKNGVTVFTSIPEIKVHSKLILIKRKEKEGIRYYSNISTGNFNENTSKVYSDVSLLTCNQDIGKDVDNVFELFKQSLQQIKFKELIVSPFQTRDHFMRLLDKEISNAKDGKDAWCYIKLNNLSDIKLINKLYQASKSGVKINCVIRGICKLVPGVKGLSENIKVISIVDRFLEHTRVFIFCNNNDEKYYISSADWMVRNLDSRIEVTTPINDKALQAELMEFVKLQFVDNKKARLIDQDMKNDYIKTKGKTNRAQEDIYNFINSIHIK